MKKIVFGITGLTLGGAERVLVDTVNELCNKYDITIFTIYPDGELEKELNPKIKLISYQNKSRAKLNFIKKIWLSLVFRFSIFRNKLYKKYIQDKYDIEVAFLEGPITWMFSKKSKTRKLVWVHNDIKEVFGIGFKAREKARINKKIYSLYDAIIFVSEDNKRKFEELYPENKVIKKVIYNYLNKDIVIKKSLEDTDDLKDDMMSFVQVSRLTEQKGIARLIEVHKRLIDEGLIHRIYIIGEGPLRNELQGKIDEYKLNDTFILMGKKSNPYPYIKKADNFILASLYEGYGMVIDEAKILNKFILITDTAAREALTGYNKSLIVSNDLEGIYMGMKKIINKEIDNNDFSKVTSRDIISDIIKVLEGE